MSDKVLQAKSPGMSQLASRPNDPSTTYKKTLEWLDCVPQSESTQLPTFKDIPPPLHQKDYQKVNWSKKSYEEHIKHKNGMTNGFATRKPRCSQPFNISEEDTRNLHIHTLKMTVVFLLIDSA